MDFATNASCLIILGIIAAGPLLVQILHVSVAPGLHALIFLAKLVLKLIADKIAETILVALLLWLAGIPVLTLLARLVLFLFDR